MLGPGNTKAALEAVAAFPGGLQVGGGITAANCADFLEAGASHVIVTRYANASFMCGRWCASRACLTRDRRSGIVPLAAVSCSRMAPSTWTICGRL